MKNKAYRCSNFTKINKYAVEKKRERNEKIDRLVDRAFRIYGEAIKKLGKT